jgi:hypothetical protein
MTTKVKRGYAWLYKARTLVGGLVVGWLLALFLTWLGWTTQIEGTAFRCTDDTYPFVWFNESLDLHRQAGDVLGAGWTWERIQAVQNLYVGAFYLIWLLGGVLAYLLMRRSESNKLTP